MNKITIALSALAFLLSLSSCKGFLDFSPSDQIPDKEAITSAERMNVAMVGVYDLASDYTLLGRNVFALSDASTDISWTDGSKGWLKTVYEMSTLEDTEGTLSDVWAQGLAVSNAAAKIIDGGNTNVLSQKLTDSDKSIAESAIGQAYGIKALSNFYLVNLFGLPYSESNKAAKGIILIKDKPVYEGDEVSRSTVSDAYESILSDIAEAKKHMAMGGTEFSPFHLDPISMTALEARVRLYMKDYSSAITLAQEVIDSKLFSLARGDEYASMWGVTTASKEDIYTIGMASDDNMSANSINNLYGSYNFFVAPKVVMLLDTDDPRRAALIDDENVQKARGLKFSGSSEGKNVSNVPVLRLSEMYLIIAEAKAQLGQPDAVDYLFEVASRNPNLSKSDIPTGKTGLLKFISDERIREFFQEGHRFFDARRNGELVTRSEGISFYYANWDVSKFVFPIPQSEVNASGIEQNTDWFKQKPTIK